MLNEDTELFPCNGFQVRCTDLFKEGEKSNEGAATAPDRTGPAIVSMLGNQIFFDLDLTEKALAG